MAGVIQQHSKYKVCAVTPFLQIEGITQIEAHYGLVNVYGQNVLSQKDV